MAIEKLQTDIAMKHQPTINIHNRDCMEAMAKMEDNAFELAIVDPPYGINVNHNMGRRKHDKKSNYKKAYWDNGLPDAKLFEELFRVSNNQIIWGANHFISQMPYNSNCWLMWDKKFGQDVSFAQFELAWTSFQSTCKKFDKFPNGSEKRIHPTQKPVALYKWLLKNYANEGDRILDTHLGSGSIAIACHDMGFDLGAYEIDHEYYQAALQRLNTHRSQLQMF